jgi:hypothetical protein
MTGDVSKPTMQPDQVSEILNRPISQELLARDVARLGYVAKDGTPRTIPIGFTWNGAEIVMCTTKNAPKVTALRRNPAVALYDRHRGGDPGLGETDRLRDHPPEPDRGTDPAARRTPARLSAITKRLTGLSNHDLPGTRDGNRRWPHAGARPVFVHESRRDSLRRGRRWGTQRQPHPRDSNLPYSRIKLRA